MRSAAKERLVMQSKKADIVSVKSENMLWENGVLGMKTFSQLKNTLINVLGSSC